MFAKMRSMMNLKLETLTTEHYWIVTSMVLGRHHDNNPRPSSATMTMAMAYKTLELSVYIFINTQHDNKKKDHI